MIAEYKYFLWLGLVVRMIYLLCKRWYYAFYSIAFELFILIKRIV